MTRPALEILSLEEAPFESIRYLNAARGGGTVTERLPIQRATVRSLPVGLDAIIAASDLQGVVRERAGAPTTLLGISLAEKLEELAFDEVIPPAARTGVVLAGDLYSVPDADKRGGHGDVTEVWRAFAERFAWVAGVAGNHDDISQLTSGGNLHLLDGDIVELSGLRIGGVGFISGNPGKRGRRAEEEQLERLGLVAVSEVDLLLCHEGPCGDLEEDQLGHPGILEVIEEYAVPLTVCGHCHWPYPIATHKKGTVLNVDARAVVLTAAR